MIAINKHAILLNDVWPCPENMSTMSQIVVRKLATSAVPNQANITLVITQQHELWLVNAGDADVNLQSCELCGFNTGRFEEIPAGGVEHKPT